MSDAIAITGAPVGQRFNIDDFWNFCSALEIESKEFGLIKLGDRLLGTQIYFIEEVFRGLNEGIHYFVTLKGRQLGISTICLALDLYWAFKYPGMQATLATDTEENRESFRTTLTMYMDGLPARWKRPAKTHNRVHLVLGNRSRLVYQVAGTRKNVGFGAGKAIAMMHATEVGKWGDGTDLTSLEASLAETNPLRLYVFESTAYGFNAFATMWDTALVATTQRAIFVGWWRNELYSLAEDSEIYRVYWDGTPTNEESVWMADVLEQYGWEITTNQLAWWRWKLNEQMRGDEQQMYEKFPPTAEYAFVMSGSQFFSVQRLSDQMKIVKVKPYDVRRFVFGGAFEDTEVVECNERTATLKIWHPPQEGGYYTVGADPAWGSSEWADRFAVSVNRCYADGCEQVAEFCTPELNTMQFAWVMLYLAGAYGDPALKANVKINLEINGPGQAVWAEVQSLKQRAFMSGSNSGMSRLLQNIQNYLFGRADSISGISGFHTKTTHDEKERMLNIMKDHHEYGTLVINSVECLLEMRNVIREDGVLGAPGRGKDDRVIAGGLAVLAWADPRVGVRNMLLQRGVTRAKAEAAATASPTDLQAGRSVENYLRAIGLADRQRGPQ